MEMVKLHMDWLFLNQTTTYNNNITTTLWMQFKRIISLKSFQKTITKKLYALEKALIICQQTNRNSSIGNVGSGDKNCNCKDRSDFILNLLTGRITNLKNEILKRDAIINYLTKELFASKSNSFNSETNLQKDKTN